MVTFSLVIELGYALFKEFSLSISTTKQDNPKRNLIGPIYRKLSL